MDLNVLSMIFALMTVSILVGGFLFLNAEQFMPHAFIQLFGYGKVVSDQPISKTDRILSALVFPKRWFTHFYVFASLLLVLEALMVVAAYVFQLDVVPAIIVYALDFLVPSSPAVPATCILIAVLLFTVQVVRRLFPATCILIAVLLFTVQVVRRLCDCVLVSVFSDKARISILHYLIGFIHYGGCALALLAEAPGFSRYGKPPTLSWSELYLREKVGIILGTVTFVFAQRIQWQSGKILASLRKNSKGVVVTNEHKIPVGGWFELVSCPHYFAEMLVYISILMIIGLNSTWVWVTAWVLVNQVIAGLLSHHWYTKTFSDYPKTRAAVIPYLI